MRAFFGPGPVPIACFQADNRANEEPTRCHCKRPAGWWPRPETEARLPEIKQDRLKGSGSRAHYDCGRGAAEGEGPLMRAIYQSRILITMLIAAHLWQLSIAVRSLVLAANPLI